MTRHDELLVIEATFTTTRTQFEVAELDHCDARPAYTREIGPYRRMRVSAHCKTRRFWERTLVNPKRSKAGQPVKLPRFI